MESGLKDEQPINKNMLASNNQVKFIDLQWLKWQPLEIVEKVLKKP